MTVYPSRELDRVVVRVPDGMRAALSRLARMNRRSVNAQVVLMLERALASVGAAAGEEFGDHAPAAASNATGLASGGNINHG